MHLTRANARGTESSRTRRWRGLDSKFQYAREFVPVDAARTRTATRFAPDLRPSTRIPAIIRSRMARRSLSRTTASIGLSASPTAWTSRPRMETARCFDR